MLGGAREAGRQAERQTDRQTDREREREKPRSASPSGMCLALWFWESISNLKQKCKQVPYGAHSTYWAPRNLIPVTLCLGLPPLPSQHTALSRLGEVTPPVLEATPTTHSHMTYTDIHVHTYYAALQLCIVHDQTCVVPML